MKSYGERFWLPVTLAVVAVLISLAFAHGAARASGAAAVSGRVLDPQGQSVREAHVALYLNGGAEPYAEQETDHGGKFVLDISNSPIKSAELVVSRHHYD